METDGIGEVAADVAAYLQQARREGLAGVRVSEGRLQGPGAQPVAPVTSAAPVGSTEAAALGRPGSLEGIAARIAACTACGLCKTRTNTVPGQGNPRPELVFVGEGPGADEDAQGVPFVGRAGQLLTKMIQAMGFTREEVWIGNIVKCRPPNNRPPQPDEMEACLPYLREQLGLLSPKVIVCLGATAVKGLLNTKTPISRMRGTWTTFGSYDVMPTFHPAYLLRNPPAKREVWEDLQAVLKKLGREPPAR